MGYPLSVCLYNIVFIVVSHMIFKMLLHIKYRRPSKNRARKGWRLTMFAITKELRVPVSTVKIQRVRWHSLEVITFVIQSSGVLRQIMSHLLSCILKETVSMGLWKLQFCRWPELISMTWVTVTGKGEGRGIHLILADLGGYLATSCSNDLS